MEIGMIKKCGVCGCKSKEDVLDIPGITFTYLSDQPTICERCVASVYGISGSWSDVVLFRIGETKI